MESRENLENTFKEYWKELGKDPEELDLSKRTYEELQEDIEKIKAIRVGFKLLFSDKSQVNLGISLLANTFNEEKDGQ